MQSIKPLIFVLGVMLLLLTVSNSLAKNRRVSVYTAPIRQALSQSCCWEKSGDHIFNKNSGNVGIGLQYPGQKLHIGDGNVLIEGGGETAFQFKRDVTFTNDHDQSPFENPLFIIGRIIEGGDGAPQFRWMYADDSDGEHVVMELDSEGIMSSVRRAGILGSHFEGHLENEAHPLFRLNSYPFMQLQMGAGGDQDTDVAVARTEENTIALITNQTTQVVVDEDGRMGIGTELPTRTLSVNGDAGGTSPWNNDSDLRLKKEIHEIDSAMSKVMKLRGVTFQWRETQNHPQGTQMGFIGQEVQKVVPEVVNRAQGTYTMQYAPLTALLVEAFQEQQEQIEQLRDENRHLRRSLDQLSKATMGAGLLQ